MLEVAGIPEDVRESEDAEEEEVDGEEEVDVLLRKDLEEDVESEQST